MDEVKRIELPATRAALSDLKAGQKVLLSGFCYTMRDAGHARTLEYLKNLEGQTLFYAGPTPPSAMRPFGAIGPTTASRMDFATPQLLEAGIVAMIGKGKRSDAVRKACLDTSSVYLVAVGGIAALLAKCVVSDELVAWEDLGTEALRRIEVVDLPVYVEIDVNGADLYREIEAI